MIFVDRSAYPAPAELLEFQRSSLPTLQEFFATAIAQRELRWPRFVFPAAVRDAVSERLNELFKGRCAYCERQALEIDHFRPRLRAGRLQRGVDHDHYWWLSAEWHNLYLCCHECNAGKGNLFPIEGPAARPLSFGDALLDELPLLIDPCHDRPEEHLRFHADGTVKSLSHRGESTISILRLNSPHLVEARLAPVLALDHDLEILKRQGADADAVLQHLESIAAHPVRIGGHMGTMHAAVLALIGSYRGVPPSPQPPLVSPPSEDLGLPAMVWLEKIEISNFRTISSLTLEFSRTRSQPAESGQPWIMVMGENGVGKSSLLQAVALACMPDALRDAQGPAFQWLNTSKNAVSGFVHLTFTDGSQRKLAFHEKEASFRSEGCTPASPLLAYGSTRLLPRQDAMVPSRPALCSAQNLFDQTHPLVAAEKYFCNTRKTHGDVFELFASSIEKLLPDQPSGKISRSAGRLKRHNRPLDELSGGYKSVLALAMDIMFHLSRSSFDMDTAQGLILLDEIELHLHPRWKIRVVEQLRSLFPNARFIVSSHDPLCVQGLRPGELNVFARHPTDASFIHEQIDVPHGTRADEVLTGPWFGMASTLDAETLQLMSEHSALLQRPTRTAQQIQRLENL